jgi:Fur family transcriptional regulator, ferric uptake regulator
MKKGFTKAEFEGEAGWERLRRHGRRATLPRQAIRQVLDQTDGGLRPEEIHARAALICPGIGLVTVYRTLALFTDLGWARRVHSPDGCHAYAAAGHSAHQVMVCRTCRRTIELPGADDLVAAIRKLERQTGFRVIEPRLELQGTCTICQQHEAAGELVEHSAGGADA